MLGNIGEHRGYLMSEPVMRALADQLGKHTAHEVVYTAAMNGIDAGQDFRTALRADARIDAITDAELDDLLDVRASLGSCAAFADRVRRACAGGRKVSAAGRLDRVPRVPLVLGPTPLHRAPRLSAELGVPVLFKRDDLAGVGLGGNKLRGLEYIVADAQAQGCDCLVTGAGPQSNWTMLAALACLRHGIEPHVVCYGTADITGAADEGNMRLHRWLGTDVRFTGDPDRVSVDAGIEDVAAGLRSAGRGPYGPARRCRRLWAPWGMSGPAWSSPPSWRRPASSRPPCGSRPGRAAPRPAWSRARP